MNLKQLSEHLNLSQTTVSRALNGYPEVSEKTRERVQAAAEQLGYRPNPRAKGLATGQAYAIGHVIPMSKQHEMVNPVFGDFIAGAGEIYSEFSYDMLVTIVDDTVQEASYRGLSARGSIDGVIVQGPACNDPRIILLDKLGLPYVVHGRASELDIDYSFVDVNNVQAFDQATRYQLDLGHRRIALINGLEHMDFAARRRYGYEKALKRAAILPDPAIMAQDEMTENYGFKEATRMLCSDNPPTAFVVSSVIAAIGVRRAIANQGMRIGQDISVITHDDDLSYLRNGEDEPLFTAMRSSVREAGRIAARTLIDRIEGRVTRPQHCLLEAEMVIGSSTCPPPERT
jgi:LacI family transcriptional regulator